MKKKRIPWNKGLTKETDDRVKKSGEKSSKTKKQKFASGETVIWHKGLSAEDDVRVKRMRENEGRTLKKKFASGELVIWNKGLTKEDDERVRLQGENAGNTKRIKYASGELVPGMKGKHHSEKTRGILRITHIGKHSSPKTEIKKGQHLSLRTEFKKGGHASLETEFKKGHVNKILWNKGKTKETDIRLREMGKKVSFTLKRKYASGDLVASSKGKKGKDAFRYGKFHTDETKEEIGRKARENWKNPSYRNKTVKAIILGSRVSPNKKEKELEELLNVILPNEYKYVGDGKVIINGKCPDFININGQKKLIELFGNFWHSNNKWFNTYNDSKERVKHFRDYGYETLIVWEDELLNKGILIEKIKDFSKK